MNNKNITVKTISVIVTVLIDKLYLYRRELIKLYLFLDVLRSSFELKTSTFGGVDFPFLVLNIKNIVVTKIIKETNKIISNVLIFILLWILLPRRDNNTGSNMNIEIPHVKTKDKIKFLVC